MLCCFPPFSCSRIVHPAAARPEILDFHLQGRSDAREAVGESGDQRAVAQIAQRRGRNGVEELAPSAPSSTGVLPVLTTCFGPRTAAAGLVGSTCPVISQWNSIRRQ